jgi:hypothetical protein
MIDKELDLTENFLKSANEVGYKGNIYKSVGVIKNCIRGGYNCTAYKYRCEEERHNLTFYINDSGMVYYTETGYSTSE